MSVKVQTENSQYLNYLYCFCALLFVLSQLGFNEADPDLWGYLSFGRRFWTEASFPIKDTFSYLPTLEPWIYHEWLTGVVFYKLWIWGGPTLLMSLRVLLALGVVFFTYKTAILSGAKPWAASIALILISPLFGISFSPVRAQIFTVLFMAIFFWLNAKSQNSQPKYLVLIGVLVEVLWVNLHGGFVAGMALLALFVFVNFIDGKSYRLPLLLFITFIPISLVNPYGFSLWTGIYNELSLTRVDVPEWWSVWKSLKNSENTVSTVFFLVFGVAALASSIIFDVKKYGSKILLLTTFVVGCLVVRHQSIFYLVAGCYLPSLFKFQLKSYYLVLILIGAIVSAVNKDIRNIFTLSEESELPIAAVAKIKNEICPANIVTELDWGSYLSWQFDGACKVAIDGRYGTVFDEEVLRDYFSLVDGKLDSNFLKKYPTNYALFRVANSVSVDFMQNPEWSLAYHDAKAKLFVRK